MKPCYVSACHLSLPTSSNPAGNYNEYFGLNTDVDAGRGNHHEANYPDGVRWVMGGLRSLGTCVPSTERHTKLCHAVRSSAEWAETQPCLFSNCATCALPDASKIE